MRGSLFGCLGCGLRFGEWEILTNGPAAGATRELISANAVRHVLRVADDSLTALSTLPRTSRTVSEAPRQEDMECGAFFQGHGGFDTVLDVLESSTDALPIRKWAVYDMLPSNFSLARRFETVLGYPKTRLLAPLRGQLSNFCNECRKPMSHRFRGTCRLVSIQANLWL